MNEQDYIKILEQKMNFYEQFISKQMELIEHLFKAINKDNSSKRLGKTAI